MLTERLRIQATHRSMMLRGLGKEIRSWPSLAAYARHPDQEMFMSRRSLTRLGCRRRRGRLARHRWPGSPRRPRRALAAGGRRLRRDVGLRRRQPRQDPRQRPRPHAVRLHQDGRNQDRCVTTAGCPAVAVLARAASPRASAGVNGSKLSTIGIAGGKHQVTYAGHPLYTYVSDDGPAETGYAGVSQFGGRWLAVQPAGRSRADAPARRGRHTFRR